MREEIVVDPVEIGGVFDRADAEFAMLAPHLWDPIGRATVDVADVGPGERVLDICCGSGGSAIPAAAAAGPHGSVDAIDLAGALLRQGRRRAAERGLANVRFIRTDATTWRPPDGGRYDVAICVHGVLMLPDKDASTARLAGLVRPGGRFAVTTWANGALEQLGRALTEALQRVRGTTAASPTGRGAAAEIDSENGLRHWLTGLGLTKVAVVRVPMKLTLTDELAWLLVLGSGLRGMLDGLDPQRTSRVRGVLLALLRDRGIGELDATTLVGVGTTSM
ncbi:methyltransferase domain-containing protein [Streptosporangiaceae bacterium NEAU-GS5]|nr:methyltransferase domain-containing protein [Streptosporangiaceae bacterium NEAU-GS5]